jgi:hypothetical protein
MQTENHTCIDTRYASDATVLSAADVQLSAHGLISGCHEI